MASSITLIDHDGTTIHLAGTGTSYTGSGSPWTSQATSPYQLSMNDRTPVWTPTAAPPMVALDGGPPFRIGADLAMRGVGPVEETVGVQMYASSHDNAASLLRLLRRALNTAALTRPCILGIQPDGASQMVYHEILSATVQETTDFINEEASVSTKLLRATITWVRSPLGGRLSSGETLINGVTISNTGTGTPDNMESLGSSGTGEFYNEGGPLNIRITPSAGSPNGEIFLATVASRTFTDTNNSLVTSSTTGASITTGTAAAATFVTTRGVRGRLLFRITNASSNLEVRTVVSGASSTNPIYTSPWIRASPSGGGVNVLLDMGGFAPRYFYQEGQATTTDLSFSVQARSRDGSATTGVLDYHEYLVYYTFCAVTRSTGATSYTTVIEQFYERSGRPAIPRPLIAYTHNAATFQFVERVRGRPPIYIPGASLYAAWRSLITVNEHTTSQTATLTATHAPLFHTLRGGG